MHFGVPLFLKTPIQSVWSSVFFYDQSLLNHHIVLFLQTFWRINFTSNQSWKISSIQLAAFAASKLEKLIKSCRSFQRHHEVEGLLNILVLAGGFKHFLFSSQTLGKMNPFLTIIVFRLGWIESTNHVVVSVWVQLVKSAHQEPRPPLLQCQLFLDSDYPSRNLVRQDGRRILGWFLWPFFGW